MIKYAKALSSLQGAEYQGCFIGRITSWLYADIENNFNGNVQVEVVRKTSSFQIISLKEAAATGLVLKELEVVLMLDKAKPQSKELSDKKTLPKDSCYWHCFSVNDVYRFSELVGDSNEIHLTEKPVVQGMLLFYQLCSELNNEVDTLTIRFYLPVYAGYKIYLVKQQGLITAYSNNQIIFTAKYKNSKQHSKQ